MTLLSEQLLDKQH